MLVVSQLAAAQTAVRHVVFDLDWTLINETNPEMAAKYPKEVLFVEGKYYRITQNAVKKIIEIHKEPDTKVSFFSGGEASRNQAVIDAIYSRIRDRVGHDLFQPHLVLSKEHLEEVSKDEKLKFSERFKKNLAWYFDLKNTVIIEDVKNFVPSDQLAHLFWLGKTYNDRPDFFASRLENPKDAGYSAPSYSEWQRNMNKLDVPVSLVIQLLRRSRALGVDLVAVLQKYDLKLCRHLF